MRKNPSETSYLDGDRLQLVLIAITPDAQQVVTPLDGTISQALNLFDALVIDHAIVRGSMLVLLDTDSHTIVKIIAHVDRSGYRINGRKARRNPPRKPTGGYQAQYLVRLVKKDGDTEWIGPKGWRGGTGYTRRYALRVAYDILRTPGIDGLDHVEVWERQGTAPVFTKQYAGKNPRENPPRYAVVWFTPEQYRMTRLPDPEKLNQYAPRTTFYSAKQLAVKLNAEGLIAFVYDRNARQFVDLGRRSGPGRKSKPENNPAGLVRLGKAVEIRYERDHGRVPGFYKHEFTSGPEVFYREKANEVVVK